MSIKFLLLGGGGVWGGGSADFIFMGAGIFLTKITGRPNGITDREKLFSHYLCVS